MTKEPGEVFGLQISEHLRGKESRKAGSFIYQTLAVGRQGEIPKRWMEGQNKSESTGSNPSAAQFIYHRLAAGSSALP